MRSRSYIATPPGATIKEQLEYRGMSQKEFASRMGMSEKHISHLINGDVHLTPEVAYNLEMVLGVPATFWNNLEAIYREKLAKVEAENALDEDKELAKKFPYSTMAGFGWMPETRKPEERVINLRKYFEVAKLSNLSIGGLIPRIACRRMSITEKADFALIAWAQRAKVEARKVETSKIDLKTLSNSLETIRAMTMKTPEEFGPELIELLADCGIAIVFLPHIGGSFLHGASFYDNDKIVIGLTLRGKDADRFWFSLFHEIGHVLMGHINKPDGTDRVDEEAADRFAMDTLIPPAAYRRITEQTYKSKETIIHFSQEIGIDPGIVVGRLQKDGFINFGWFNELKTKYELTA